MAEALRAPVLLADVVRDVILKVQDVANGVLSPEEAFPPVVKPPPPDPIDPDPEPCEKCHARHRPRRRCWARPLEPDFDEDGRLEKQPIPQPSKKRELPKPPSKRRVCATCGKRRKITQFYVNAKARGGYAIHCRVCWQAKVKVRRSANPALHKKWSREANERYRETDLCAERHARYRATYKGVLTERLTAHKQRAAREGIRHDLTKADLKTIAKVFFGRCAYCNVVTPDFYLDHVIAVRDGGPDVPANLVPACRPCNRKKGRKNVFEMIQDAFWDEKLKKRYAKILRHCWSARGWEILKPKLEEFERAAGGMDPALLEMESWMRLLVRRGMMTKDEAKLAVETLSEDGLLELRETFSWTLEQEEKEDRREAMRYA